MDENRTAPVQIPVDSEDFAVILECAVRHALTRRSVPHRVINFITPLLPSVNVLALRSLDQYLTEASAPKSGQANPNAELWAKFLADVRAEKERRGEPLYVSWNDRKTDYTYTDVSE